MYIGLYLYMTKEYISKVEEEIKKAIMKGWEDTDNK
jgi:hypothetical protein